MPTYNVTIKGTVIKTIQVEADNEEDAIEEAHSLFTVKCEDIHEDYNEEMLNCKKVVE